MELLKTREVAEILKSDVYSVRRALRDGRLPGYKTFCGWRINKADLETYLENARNIGK